MHGSLHESASKVKAMSRVGTACYKRLAEQFKKYLQTFFFFILLRDIERGTFVTILALEKHRNNRRIGPSQRREKVLYRLITDLQSFLSVGCLSACKVPGLGSALSIPRWLVVADDSDSGYMRSTPLASTFYNHTNNKC